MPTKKPLSFEGVHCFLRTLFAGDLHAKRVLSLAGATLGAGATHEILCRFGTGFVGYPARSLSM